MRSRLDRRLALCCQVSVNGVCWQRPSGKSKVMRQVGSRARLWPQLGRVEKGLRFTSRPLLALVLCYALLEEIFLLVHHGSAYFILAVDDLASVAGPVLLAGIFVWQVLRTEKQARGASDSGRDMLWAPVLLALFVVSTAAGDSIWTVYEVVLRQETPFPSGADVL